MSDIPPVVLDAETSIIKLTAPRAIGIIAAVVLLTSAAGNRLSAMASDEDVTKAVAAHAAHPHVATDARINAVEDNDANQDAKLAVLDTLPRQLERVEARIDVVIRAGLEGRARVPMQRAARQVRRSAGVTAGAANDPLAGLDGL